MRTSAMLESAEISVLSTPAYLIDTFRAGRYLALVQRAETASGD